MEIYENRLSTFSASRTKKLGLPAHSAWPLKPSTHPRLTPDALASAGWYYTPTKAEPDLVTCFLCKKELSGWEEEDDPYREHVGRRDDKCGWARTKCAVEVLRMDVGTDKINPKTHFTEPDALPQSKQVEAARLATFGKWWPHDKKKAWFPNSKNLAKAGFVFTPTLKAPDTASCLYCDLGLDGWDPKDDPRAEHEARMPRCAFFTAKLYDPSQVPPSSISSAPNTSMADPIEDGEEEEDDGFEMVEAPPPPPPTKGSRGKKASTASAAIPQSTKSTKSVASSKSRPAPKASSPTPESAALLPPRKPTASSIPSSSKPPSSSKAPSASTTRTRQLSNATIASSSSASIYPSSDAPSSCSTSALNRSTRSNASNATVTNTTLGAGQSLAGVEEEETAPQSKKAAAAKKPSSATGSSKGGKKKAASAKTVMEEEVEEVEMEVVPEEGQREEMEDVVMEEAEEEEEVVAAVKPAPKGKGATKKAVAATGSKAKKGKAAASREEPDEETLAQTTDDLEVATPSSSSNLKSPSKLPRPTPSSSTKTPRAPPHTSIPTSTTRTPRSHQPSPREIADQTSRAILEGAMSASKVIQTWARVLDSPRMGSHGSPRGGVQSPLGRGGEAPPPPSSSHLSSLPPSQQPPSSSLTQPPPSSLPNLNPTSPSSNPPPPSPPPQSASDTHDDDEAVYLTESESSLSTEAWIRMEFRARHDELLRLGEDVKIGAFVEAAREARRRLEEEIDVID